MATDKKPPSYHYWLSEFGVIFIIFAFVGGFIAFVFHDNALLSLWTFLGSIWLWLFSMTVGSIADSLWHIRQESKPAE